MSQNTRAFGAGGPVGFDLQDRDDELWPGWGRCSGDHRFNVRVATRVELVEAVAICRGCSARLECLDFVIDRGGQLGPSLGGRCSWRVFGGVLPGEMRQRLRSRWGESMRPPTLGRSKWDTVDEAVAYRRSNGSAR